VALVPETNSRFAIVEVRGGPDEHGHSTLVYHLRDADTVSDADVAAGRRPKTIKVFDEPMDAVAAAQRYVRERA
jgi:hypothetical protein